MVARVDGTIVQIEWQGNEVIIDEYDFEYLDNIASHR